MWDISAVSLAEHFLHIWPFLCISLFCTNPSASEFRSGQCYAEGPRLVDLVDTGWQLRDNNTVMQMKL